MIPSECRYLASSSMVVCCVRLPVCRGEAQAKAGKREQTQGHLRKKIADMQRQIKQTAKDTTRYERM